MADYVPYVNPVALDTMPLVWGDTAQANALGTSAMASGSDPAQSVKTSLTTGPGTAPKLGYGTLDGVDSLLNFIQNPQSIGAINATDVGRKLATNPPPAMSYGSTFVWSVVLVVLALFLFSRGIGMIGEEGATSLLEIDNPEKYPGIGHAVQSLKKGRK